MRPEVNQLIINLNEISRAKTAGETTITIQELVAALRSNLTKLEDLVGLRLKTREHLSALLQALFQSNAEAERLFAPWLEVMEMQISRAFRRRASRDAEPAASRSRSRGSNCP